MNLETTQREFTKSASVSKFISFEEEIKQNVDTTGLQLSTGWLVDHLLEMSNSFKNYTWPWSSVKSLGYIYSNSQKYIVWVKIIDFSFMPKNEDIK